ncbi:hypothetical protein FGB62_183g05 [Gracilaria domingensis]|nr:hypothetical protein FGB62_183g05 [Gracilaria domingensis]
MQVCSGNGGIIPPSSARTPGAMAQTAPGGHMANSLAQGPPNGTYSRRVLHANVPWNRLDIDNPRRHSRGLPQGSGGQLLSGEPGVQKCCNVSGAAAYCTHLNSWRTRAQLSPLRTSQASASGSQGAPSSRRSSVSNTQTPVDPVGRLQTLADAWLIEGVAGGDTEAVALEVTANLKQTFVAWWPPWLASAEAGAAEEAAVHLAVTIALARVALEAECKAAARRLQLTYEAALTHSDGAHFARRALGRLPAAEGALLAVYGAKAGALGALWQAQGAGRDVPGAEAEDKAFRVRWGEAEAVGRALHVGEAR